MSAPDITFKPLLVEIGTEELPPKALDELAYAFAMSLEAEFADAYVPRTSEPTKVYASPRRLAAYFPGVVVKQGSVTVKHSGPPVNAALNADGTPTPALVGFAKRVNAPLDALSVEGEGKAARYFHLSTKEGEFTAQLLPGMVERALKRLPIPRPMRWAEHDYSFVRPVHWLVMLHGAEIVEGEVLGLKSGRKSRGHRFMHPNPVHVTDADSWLDALRAAKVLADPVERRQRIRDEVARAAIQTGGVPRLDDALLEEIANLTEWPAAIACTFERDFLAVPPEALVTTMETNQKFVPVFNAAGALTEHFIGVANIESKDPAEIRKGYERVIRPRFADAKFFWDEDLKTPLADYQQPLKNVTYQQALGSLWDKSVRVAELARVIASRVGVDAGAATRAASLSKCDLLTRMVGEFPELQGVMGRYYARHQGEGEAVAQALDSYYQPRFARDAIAADPVGRVLAVAERLDTLAGIFAVGTKPSGNKDPFALRRAALGLARTLVEAGLELDLRASFAEALELLPESALAAGVKPGKDGKPVAFDAGARRVALLGELTDFVIDRLRGYYAELGFDTEQFEAVLAVAPTTLPDFDRRLRAVAEFGRRPEAASLAAANKRVANILRKAEEDAGAPVVVGMVDPACFESPAEHALADALDAALADTAAPRATGDYTAVLARLAQLQAPVDAFFDAVLVNAEDARVRANRLGLLARLKAQFAAVADIARL